VVVWSMSRDDVPISLLAAYQLSTDPANSVHSFAVVQEGAAAYVGGRWGDYAILATDPLQHNVVWQAGEFAGAEGGWSTFVSPLEVPSVDSIGPTVGSVSRALVAPQPLGSKVSLRINWPPASDPSSILRYELQMKTGTGKWVKVPLKWPTDTSATVAVTVGAKITFRVRATDGATNVGTWTTSTAKKVNLLQETANAIRYGAGWKRASLTGASGGYVRKNMVGGGIARLTFTGSSVAIVTARGPSRGGLDVRVDGGSWEWVNLYWTSNQTKRVAWSVGGLGPGSHTVEIQMGAQDAHSTGTRVDLDAFLVQP